MSEKVVETSSIQVEIDQEGEEKFVNQYEVKSVLGEGTFGRVLLVTDTKSEDQAQFAMKCLSQSFLKKKREFKREGGRVKISTALDDVQREIAIMKKIKHPNVVQLREVIRSETSDKLYMIVELVLDGQLMVWSRADKQYKTPEGRLFSENDARLIFRDMIMGIDYLHAQNIVHRDLKPENLLRASKATSNVHVKIADFGVSYMFDENPGEDTKVKSSKGTYQFQPPECIVGQEFDPYLADVWAMGVNLFVFVFGSLPFYGKTIDDLFDAIENSKLEIPDTASPSFRRLLSRLLEKDPSKRVTLAELKKDEWVNANKLQPLSEIERLTDVEVSSDEILHAYTELIQFRTAVLVATGAKKWLEKSQKSRMQSKVDDQVKPNLAAHSDDPKDYSTGISQRSGDSDNRQSTDKCCCALM